MIRVSQELKSYISAAKNKEKDKILAIIQYAAVNGNLIGYKIKTSPVDVRNKNSDNVPSSDPAFLAKVRYAQSHQLWHIHTGFYNDRKNTYPIDGYRLSSCGKELVSQMIMHYKDGGAGKIDFLNISGHPPFDIYAVRVNAIFS